MPTSPFFSVVQGFLNGTAEPYQWGILAGCLVYLTGVVVVLYLLVAGGSFERMREQAEAYKQLGVKALQVPLTSKPRLYEALLEASRSLPRRPHLDEGCLRGRGVELRLIETGDEVQATDEKGALARTLFGISDGSPRYGHGGYDPIEQIWRWLPESLGPPEGASEMRKFLDRRMRAREADSATFYVLDQPSGYVIGMASILENTPTHLRAEIGDIWLTPAFRGTYAGLEAGQLLLRFLFETLGYRRVEWRCDADNYAAQKAAERMGFVKEGVLRKHMIWREANRDTVLYALTNSDWRDSAASQIEARLEKLFDDVKGLRKTEANATIGTARDDSASAKKDK